MTTQEVLNLFDETTTRVRAKLAKKNHDYTQGARTDALSNFKISETVLHIEPEKGLLVRVLDKIARITTFVECGELKVDNESAQDAVDDIIGYMTLLAALMEEKK